MIAKVFERSRSLNSRSQRRRRISKRPPPRVAIPGSMLDFHKIATAKERKKYKRGFVEGELK